MKPIQANKIIEIKTSSNKLLDKSLIIKLLNKTAAIINTPPIVGVPFFERCELGPSSLISSPNFLIFKYFIKGFPAIKTAEKANKKQIFQNVQLKNTTLVILLLLCFEYFFQSHSS